MGNNFTHLFSDILWELCEGSFLTSHTHAKTSPLERIIDSSGCASIVILNSFAKCAWIPYLPSPPFLFLLGISVLFHSDAKLPLVARNTNHSFVFVCLSCHTLFFFLIKCLCATLSFSPTQIIYLAFPWQTSTFAIFVVSVLFFNAEELVPVWAPKHHQSSDWRNSCSTTFQLCFGASQVSDPWLATYYLGTRNQCSIPFSIGNCNSRVVSWYFLGV